MVSPMSVIEGNADIYDEVAYVYDGSLEGLLSAIFAAYAYHEQPADITCHDHFQPRFCQYIRTIETDVGHAYRVRKGLIGKGGRSAFMAVLKASLSSNADAPLIAYRFVRYVMDEHSGTLSPYSNIAHKSVSPLYKICRSVDQECEHMRQFVRFEHIKDDKMDFWFARCNPKDSVIPLVMDHFVERFNVQPFMIFDEVHDLSGIYDGGDWYLVKSDEKAVPDLSLLSRSAEEADIQDAWKRFYKAIAVKARYNPELRQHFMPQRFWKNLTEMQGDDPTKKAISRN